MVIKKNIKSKLTKPKLTFDRLGQISFTLKEVTKIAFKVKPRLLIAVFVLNAIWGLSSVPTFYLEKLIIDNLVKAAGNPNWQPLFYSAIVFTGLLALLSLLRSSLGGLNGFLRRTLSRYFDGELDILMGSKISELDLATIEDPDFRDKLDKIERESGQRAWGLMMPLSDIPNYLVGFISSAGVLLLIHPLVSVGIFVVSIPSFLIDSKFIKKEYELNGELAPKYRVWGWIGHYLTRNRNFMEMKILRISNHLKEKMGVLINEILSKQTSLHKKRELYSFISSLPLTIYDFAFSVLLVFWVIVGKITIGSLQFYLRSLRNAEQNLSGLVSSFLEIYENYIYVADLIWFLNLEPELKGHKKSIQLAGKRKSSIEFENVWFKYPRSNKWIVKSADFKINQGEKIALVGENGAGKSTLIKLLGRFYQPQKGKILVNGVDLEETDISELREKLAVLFQEFEIYPFSAKEAIGYGDTARLGSLDEIKKAAQKTGIDKFIESLPLKYDNPITPEFEKGVRPSLGQYQRFGISRVLFRKDAQTLILDEPTSNVDPEAEEKIFKELVKITRDKILIFVTQRFSTVRIADRIFVMHEGRIIEEGTHHELMRANGKYARLYNLQAQAYKI